MKIRDKITLQILATIGIILFVAFATIFLSFSRYRAEDFYRRLEAKAQAVGQMLVEIDEIDASLLSKMEQNNPSRLHNEHILIFNLDNTPVFSNDERHQINLSQADLRAAGFGNGVRKRQGNFEIAGTSYQGGESTLIVFVAAEDIFGFRKIVSLRNILLLVFALSIITTTIAARILAGRALQPIRTVISQVDAIGVANLNARVNAGSGRDEVALLASTFNKMLERLEGSFRMQKDFIGNASHELKTPLTVITGELEVMLMQDRTSEEYKSTMRSVLEEISNLNDLSERLLMLAQASSATSRLHFSEVRVDDLVWQARSELLKRDCSCTVLFEMLDFIDDEKYFLVKGSEFLLKTAVINLMENGCKFSYNQAVKVQLSMAPERIILDFNDNGPGIPEEEIPKIFEPFYRSAAAGKVRGHGIGLALTQRIISLHNGTIAVRCGEGNGTNFRVVLPGI
ncbi:MAG: ATP-binding protein [Bacteroidales bacterium]